MALNRTTLAHWLGINLGYSHAHLEVTMEFLFQVIEKTTLKTFSHYFPFLKTWVMDVKKCAIPNRMGYYRIPNKIVKSDRYIGINKFLPSDIDVVDNHLHYSQRMNPFDAQAFYDFRSFYRIPPSFKLIPPNIIEIQPRRYSYGNILLELKLEHNKNFYTIPYSLEEEFKKLALADCRTAIYDIRKNYPSVSTAFGNVEFDSDSFRDAKDERKEIIDIWKNSYYKSPNRKKIYIG